MILSHINIVAELKNNIVDVSHNFQHFQC